MQVQYLKKATGTITAQTQLPTALHVAGSGYEVLVPVRLTNRAGELVCQADITCWISPRQR